VSSGALKGAGVFSKPPNSRVGTDGSQREDCSGQMGLQTVIKGFDLCFNLNNKLTNCELSQVVSIGYRV
jgi:hypothetical protein